MKLHNESLLELLDYDDTAYQNVLLIFVESSESIITELKHHRSSHNFAGLNIEAHKLKSAARSIGAVELADACEKLESRTEEENGVANAITIEKYVDELLRLFANVKSHIRTLMAAD